MFTLAEQGQYFLPYFSIRLSYTSRSEITFGSYNRARVAGRPRWYNASPSANGVRTYWQMALSTPLIGGKIAAPLATHILDSGTTLIIAPPSAASTFWANVPGSQPYSDEFWSYPCASPPDRCFGAVIGENLGLGSAWLLGDAFMTNVYVMHDVVQNRIGLSLAR